MTRGAVVRAADVHADYTPTGACVRTLLDSGPDRPHLVRRLVDVPPRSRFDDVAGAAGELWFVISGAGWLDIDGHPRLPVERDRGLWIPARASYHLHSDGPADLRLDAVTLPAAGARAAATHEGAGTASTEADSSVPLTRDLADCEVETTGDRQFRVLFGPGRSCATATQFVGQIPPGRAPEHSHPYDEVVLVLEGEGIVHVDGAEHPLTPGTCTHLPPGQLHCLENNGTTSMRVLGVFHPANSPAAKLETRG